MFDIPKWGADVPKTNVIFSVKSKSKNNKSNEQLSNSKHSKSKTKPMRKKSFKVKKTLPETKFTNKQNGKLNRNDYFAQKRQLNKQIAQNQKEEERKYNKSVKKIKTNKKGLKTKNDRNTEMKAKPKMAKIKAKTLSNKRKMIETELDNSELQNFDADKPDEALLSAKKIKFNESITNDDVEHLLFGEKEKVNDIKPNSKKEKLRRVLDLVNRSSIDVSGSKLRERMLERLKAAQFRYLNERLYTTTGSEAIDLFQSDPSAFEVYHQGYQQQLKKWPINPLDVIVKRIMKLPKSEVVADMGCGRAELSRRVPQRVVSLDVAGEPGGGVVRCDMARTPLPAASLHAAVYCLSLMGTHLTQCLLEANRVLKERGLLLIAEVESRFDDVDTFVQDVQRLGFQLKSLDKTNKMFFFIEFVKTKDPPAKKSKLPTITLKPCLYKRR